MTQLPAAILESAYDSLKEQYKAVQTKLRDVNLKLNSKVGELDIVTYYLDNILSHISQGLIFINFDGYITSYNPAAELLLGVEGHSVLFQRFEDHFSDTLFGFSMCEALTTKKAPSKNLTNIENTQRELEIESTFMIKKDPEALKGMDSLQGILVLMRDVTDILKLQEIAQRNSRLKELGEMAAMVAHEIRNPLGSIKGFASLLYRDLKDQPNLQRLSASIIEGTDSLNLLVTNVLNFSRPLQLHTEKIDLVTLVQDLCKQVHADVNFNQKIEIQMNAEVERLAVMIDSSLIKSALLNVIVNALQAMPEGGELTLSISANKSNAIVKISDTGMGIAPENLSKLCTPFFTTKEKGNGFGLAEVFRVMQIHDGNIDFKSEIGKGTTVTLKIPLNFVHSV